MTQKERSKQQQNQERELEVKQLRLGRRHFLTIGAGAAAGFVLPSPTQAQTVKVLKSGSTLR